MNRPLTRAESIMRMLRDVPELLEDWNSMDSVQQEAWLHDYRNELSKLEEILRHWREV